MKKEMTIRKRPCPECRTFMEPGQTTLHFERDGFVADLGDVPAYICPHCGTEIVTGPVAEETGRIVESLFKATQVPPEQMPFASLSFQKVIV
jgi:YgiT-type zinc finger domain-containing protein